MAGSSLASLQFVKIPKNTWLRAVLLFAACYSCAVLAGFVSFQDKNPFTIWLSAGVLVAALLLDDRRTWPFYLLAGLAAHLAFDLASSTLSWTSLLMAAAICLQAYLGAWLVKRFFPGSLTFSSFGEMLGLLFFTAVGSTLIGAAARTLAGFPGEWNFPYWVAGLVSWTEQMLGVLALAPIILSWSGYGRERFEEWKLSRWIEGFVFIAVMVFSTWFVFSRNSPGHYGEYLMVIFIGWAALRFGPRGASTVGLLMALGVVYYTLRGLGPFSDIASPPREVESLMVYLGVFVSGGLLLAALFRERTLTGINLAESEDRFRAVIESSSLGILIFRLDEGGRLLLADFNPAAGRILKNPGLKKYAGKKIEEVLPALRRTEIPDLFRQVALQGMAWGTEKFEYKDERVDGTFDVHVFQTSPGMAAVMFADVTGQRKAQAAVEESEARYRAIFNNSAVSLWEEDYQDVKQLVDRIKDEGHDVRQYLEMHPEVVDRAKALIRFTEVNDWTLRLYEASSKEELFASTAMLFPSEPSHSFKDELIAVA